MSIEEPRAGTEPEGVVMAQLDNGEWSVETFGPNFNRPEFPGQLTASTQALTDPEAHNSLDASDD